MKEVEEINIPAYQRKRSISARARKKPNYLRTIRAKMPARRRKSPVKKTRSTLADIPAKASMPSKELFSSPFDIAPTLNSSGLREWTTVGICDGYINKIKVAIIQLTSPLRVGDTILFERQDGLFEQHVDSMQIDRKDVTLARTGSDIGLKVSLKPKVGTSVYKLNN